MNSTMKAYQAGEECNFFKVLCIGMSHILKVIQRAAIKRRWLKYSVRTSVGPIFSFLSLHDFEPQKVRLSRLKVKHCDGKEFFTPYKVHLQSTNLWTVFFFFPLFQNGSFINHTSPFFFFLFLGAKIWINGVISRRHVLENPLVSWTLNLYL